MITLTQRLPIAEDADVQLNTAAPEFGPLLFGVGTGVALPYVIVSQDRAAWEQGTGYLYDGGIFERDTVTDSSDGGAKVLFGPGLHVVTISEAGGGGGGSGTVTSVDITPPAAGITASGGPITTSGAITLALADDLAGIEAITGTGGVERTGANTYATYTLTSAGKAIIDDADAAAQRATLGNVWPSIVKTTDETRVSTAVVADDGALTLPIAAGERVRFRFTIFYSTNSTADFLYDLNGPSSPTALYYRIEEIIAGAGGINGIALQTLFAQTRTANTSTGAGAQQWGRIVIDGVVRNGANAGSLVLRWAQGISSAAPNNTTVLAGSTIEYIVF